MMITTADVAEVRLLLRSSDSVARRTALGLIASWPDRDVGGTEAREVLDLLISVHPAVPSVKEQPAESLARVLWSRPTLLDADEVLRAFSLSAAPARSALFRLLLARGDEEGVDALEFLFGPSGNPELLPVPTRGLLAPLVDYKETSLAMRVLLAALRHREWLDPAMGTIETLEFEQRLDDEDRSQVMAWLVPAGERIVEACDQLALETESPAAASAHAQLARLAALLVLMDTPSSRSVLHRMLSSADPNASAIGSVGLVQMGETVGDDRFEMISRSPTALSRLTDGLARLGAMSLLPTRFRRPDVQARANLVTWLADESELGREPDEMELIERRDVWVEDADDGLGGTSRHYLAEVYLFRFRMRSPHWSSARGWMVGAAGEWTYSCYVAEDEASLYEHVEMIRAAVERWPGHPGIGESGESAD